MVLRNMRYWKFDTSPFCQRCVMVDFWNSWRGEYNDAALKTKCVLTTNQYTNKQTNKNKRTLFVVSHNMCRLQQVEELAPLSSRSADQQTWTSQTLSGTQRKKGKKNSRFTIAVHGVVIFLNCVKRHRLFLLNNKRLRREKKKKMCGNALFWKLQS